jgi:large subunit ribosomal protein L24
VQTTLLGLAIAAILALVTALVGPLFVDWTHYRSNIEAEAARMAGQPVRIGGAIDVRLLPTPIIVLHDVEMGSRAAPVFGAQTVRIELALDGLMRGQFRASALTLTGPEFLVALDRNGRLASRVSTLGFDLERVSIDRLAIVDGRVNLEDAANGLRTTLEKVSFGGDVRPQSGQVRGDGAFSVAGAGYHYQVTTGRRDGAMRLRFSLEPQDRPLTFEAEGLLSLEADAPTFEGTASLSRPAGAVLANGEAVPGEPWRVSANVRADSMKATFEHAEAQYGPDDRRIRLNGTAGFVFGAQPQFESTLSARQIDLDRTLAAKGGGSRPPAVAIRELFDAIAGMPRLPFAVKLGVGIDAVTLGGATLQSVRADVSAARDGWTIDNLEFRAPGVTQVKLSGRAGGEPGGAAFSGPLSIDSADPGLSMAWLQGTDRPKGMLGAFRFTGDVTVDKSRIAFERVSADIDRKPLQGRLAYTYPAAGKPALLDVAVKAAELDVEAAQEIVGTVLSGAKFERPGEITLALDIGRASYAGFTAVSANANLRFDSAGLRVEKLSIADFGGAALNGSGEIDLAAANPHGAIALNLAAPKIDGIAALADRFWPGAGAVLTRNAARLAPARIDATLKVEPKGGPAGDAVAQLSLKGQLGTLRLDASGQGAGNAGTLRSSDLKFAIHAASDDGALVSVARLDEWMPAATARRPDKLDVTASGTVASGLRIDATLATEGFQGTASGTATVADGAPRGTFKTSVASSDVRELRRPSGPAFPVSLKSNVTVSGGGFTFADLDGNAGGAAVRGRLAVSFNDAASDPLMSDQRTINVDGKLALGSIDVPALLAGIVGASGASDAQSGAWPATPFNPTFFSSLRGHVDIEAARATLLSSIEAQKLRGSLGFGAKEIVLDNIVTGLGGGEARAEVRLARAAGGYTVHGKATLTKVDSSSLIKVAGQTPIGGRLSGDLSFESTGTSPAGLIAGLQGSGSMKLENGKIAGMDRNAIDAAIRAADRASPAVPQQVADAVSRSLDNATLAVPSASGAQELVNGRLRLGRLATPGLDNATLSASLDLLEETLDARVTLSGPASGDVQGLRAELAVLYKGPVSAPRRTVDVSALTSWLTLRSVERASKRLEAEEREAKRRAQFEAQMREEDRQREAAREQSAVPAVTGTAPVSASAPALPANRTAPAAATGLFAPVLPAPDLISRDTPRPDAMLTAPALAPPTVVPSVAATPVPTGRVAPEQPGLAPLTASDEKELPDPESVPAKALLPLRRPAPTAARPAPLDLSPRAPAVRYLQQHNAPQ